MLFSNVRWKDSRFDLRLSGGCLTEMVPAGTGSDLLPVAGEEHLRGGWLTPVVAEPHVHLDAALLGARRPNRSGTLREGIANWAELRAGLTAADVQERALKTIEMYMSFGTYRIRTHVDTGSLVAVGALIELRDQLIGRGVELQIVAFPQEGILRAKRRKEMWVEAVEMGCDAVGGIPHFERTTEEGWQTVRMAFDLAEKHDLLVDFHCDETDDPGCRNLEVVCAQTQDRGFQGRVVAGHCTALHSYSNPYAAKVIELVASSGVQVVANPLDNIVLQGRYDGYPRRRGITRVDELWAAGACVGVGHDSVMDPWYRLGTANMVDAAYMLVHGAQLTGEEDMAKVFDMLIHANHQPFGGPPSYELGDSVRLLWWESDDPIELLRTRPRPKVFG